MFAPNTDLKEAITHFSNGAPTKHESDSTVTFLGEDSDDSNRFKIIRARDCGDGLRHDQVWEIQELSA